MRGADVGTPQIHQGPPLSHVGVKDGSVDVGLIQKLIQRLIQRLNMIAPARCKLLYNNEAVLNLLKMDFYFFIFC